jgi:hypothetical protein
MRRLAILLALVAAVGCKSNDGDQTLANPDPTRGTYTATNPTTTPATTPSTGQAAQDTTRMPSGTSAAPAQETTTDTTTGTASGTTGTETGTTPSTTGANTGQTGTTGQDDMAPTAGEQRSTATFSRAGASKNAIEGTLDILQTEQGMKVSGNFGDVPRGQELELVLVSDCTADAEGRAIGTIEVDPAGSVTFTEAQTDIAATGDRSMTDKSIAVRESGKTENLGCTVVTRSQPAQPSAQPARP